MNRDDIIRMALDALEHGLPIIEDFGGKEQLQIQHKAIAVLYEALRARLAQPEQEPVAWMHTTATGNVYFRKKPQDKVFNPQPVYTAPPQREWCQCKDAPNDCTYEKNCRVPQIDAAFKRIEWQGLTDDEITRLRHLYDPTAHWSLVAFAHAIEAKLKEKNA